jgi:hypothetical protein
VLTRLKHLSHGTKTHLGFRRFEIKEFAGGVMAVLKTAATLSFRDAPIKSAFLPLPRGEGWGEGGNSTSYPSP